MFKKLSLMIGMVILIFKSNVWICYNFIDNEREKNFFGLEIKFYFYNKNNLK